MYNMTELKKKVITDYDSPAFILLERVIKEMEKRGIEPHYVMGLHVPAAYERPIDINSIPKHISITTVSRHNGTEANVSVEIAVSEMTGRSTAKRTCVVKVPKDASEKVINRRIDKILEALQTA